MKSLTWSPASKEVKIEFSPPPPPPNPTLYPTPPKPKPFKLCILPFGPICTNLNTVQCTPQGDVLKLLNFELHGAAGGKFK